MKVSPITSDDVEDRLDIVRDLVEDKLSSPGNSEEDETDLKVHQEVGKIVTE